MALTWAASTLNSIPTTFSCPSAQVMSRCGHFPDVVKFDADLIKVFSGFLQSAASAVWTTPLLLFCIVGKKKLGDRIISIETWLTMTQNMNQVKIGKLWKAGQSCSENSEKNTFFMNFYTFFRLWPWSTHQKCEKLTLPPKMKGLRFFAAKNERFYGFAKISIGWFAVSSNSFSCNSLRLVQAFSIPQFLYVII